MIGETETAKSVIFWNREIKPLLEFDSETAIFVPSYTTRRLRNEMRSGKGPTQIHRKLDLSPGFLLLLRVTYTVDILAMDEAELRKP